MYKRDRRIAVVSINKNKFSETFIHAHVRMLPYMIYFLHGGYLPTKFGDDDQPISTSENDGKILEHDVKNFLRQNKIELVLAQYGPSGVKMMNVCHELKIPLIVYFRGYDAYREDILNDYGKDYPQLFKISSALFVVSNVMKEQLKNLGAPEEKIHYNPSGANTEIFKYHDAGKNPSVLFASGRFESLKSPHLTILAFEKALKKNPDARLIMAGDGALLEACKILVNALKIKPAVDLKGILPHAEIANLMSQSRAFVQHSVTTPSNHREGTPVAVMEAGTSGLPVIATKHAGISEVVEHEKTGFLVEEGDIDAMAFYMDKILNDAALATQLGRAAHEKITSRFTTNLNIERLSKVIDELLDKK